MPATTTTKAPVGPPICVRDPPSAETIEAGDDRAVDARLRRQAGCDGERHGQRQRDETDSNAGGEIGDGRGAVVPCGGRDEPRQQFALLEPAAEGACTGEIHEVGHETGQLYIIILIFI